MTHRGDNHKMPHEEAIWMSINTTGGLAESDAIVDMDMKDSRR